jgi:cellulose biosynthesis protein BcsQ
MGKILPGIVLGFANTKGGSGKSTLTAILAGYLHTEGKNKGLTTAVIDIDNAQNSMGNIRDIEENKAGDNEYEILRISSSDVANQINYLKEAFDIIIIDFPGNVLQEGVVQALHLLDITIIPFECNQMSLPATIAFYELYKDVVQAREKAGYKTTVRGVPNRVSSNLLEYRELIGSQGSLPFKLLKNHIKDSKVEFQRKITTVESEYKNNAPEFCDEVLELIINYMK